MKKYILIFLAILGMVDAGYLSFEHVSHILPPCSTSIFFVDCGKVLNSSYSIMFGVPLAYIGLIHYSILTVMTIGGVLYRKQMGKFGIIIFSTIGLISSLYFIFLQLVIIKAICFYCMISAVDSILVFILAQRWLPLERKKVATYLFALCYRYAIKPFFFLFDPELIHNLMTYTGELLGHLFFVRALFRFAWVCDDTRLHQRIHGIQFNNPVGLAAGFDYEARLAQILPAVGFGFNSVGTITNDAYEGNPKPRLGRLPKSKSLMVNKGFKNFGAKHTSQKLSRLKFQAPLGISIGRTNSTTLLTVKESIEDIMQAFRVFEKSGVANSYYELNISCPNLLKDISFYPPNSLDALLTAVDSLHLKKPVFIKMPIEKSDAETLEMLKIISKHSPVGVIFGNLWKGKTGTEIDTDEARIFSVGNFSGKPTWNRSNELISLTYKHYAKRFIIIGCGGIFSGKDAYEKISRGATLVQLITGMIFQGPQLISQINLELLELLHADGYTHVSQAIGRSHR